MPFRITVSEPKERKAYQVEKDVPTLVGMKIGQSFDGSMVGLTGYTLEITGGSDKDGFPMRKDFEGPGRRRAVVGAGPGYRPEEPGIRKMKSLRGNMISLDTMQINTMVKEKESHVKPIPELINWQPKPKEEKAPKEGKKE